VSLLTRLTGKVARLLSGCCSLTALQLMFTRCVVRDEYVLPLQRSVSTCKAIQHELLDRQLHSSDTTKLLCTCCIHPSL
jgi:hypothetical protein